MREWDKVQVEVDDLQWRIDRYAILGDTLNLRGKDRETVADTLASLRKRQAVEIAKQAALKNEAERAALANCGL